MPALSSSPRRTSVWEWGQTVLLAANLMWTTLSLGGYRAETMVVTSSLTALMLAVHFAWRLTARGERESGKVPRWHLAGWMFVPFLAYAAANVWWVTPVRWLGWQDWLEWAQMIAVFWVVVNDVRARATRKFLFGAMLGAALISTGMACYQRFAQPDWLMLGAKQSAQFQTRSGGAFAVPNSFAALLILLLPATALAMWRRSASAVQRVGFGYLAAMLLLGLGLTVSRGAWIGLAGALVVWPLVAGGGWKKRATRATAVVAVIAAGVAVVYFTVPVVRERLGRLAQDAGEKSRPEMWRAAWGIFREHPVVGSGAGSYNAFFEKFRPEHQQKDPGWAHSDYLNTLSDYGAVGFALFFGACAVIAWRCWRVRGVGAARAAGWREPGDADAGGRASGGGVSGVGRGAANSADHDWLDSRAFTTALAIGLLAFGLHLVVDFHLKIPALAMAVATVAGLAVGRAWTVEESGIAAPAAGRAALRRVGSGLGAAVVLLGGVFWGRPHYRAEAERRPAREALDGLARKPVPAAERGAITRAAREAFSRAVEIDPANSQAWADRAYSAAILGHDEPAREKELGVGAESDARRALEHGAVVPELWLRLGVALDMQDRWNEAGYAFSEALRLAPNNATTWFYFAYHLSLNKVALPRARAAVATSLRLDPSLPEADALREHLAAHR